MVLNTVHVNMTLLRIPSFIGSPGDSRGVFSWIIWFRWPLQLVLHLSDGLTSGSSAGMGELRLVATLGRICQEDVWDAQADNSRGERFRTIPSSAFFWWTKVRVDSTLEIQSIIRCKRWHCNNTLLMAVIRTHAVGVTEKCWGTFIWQAISCSPPARWGWLDFIRVVLLLLLLLLLLLHLLLVLLLLLHHLCKGLSALGTAGPQPGTFRAQWAPLDLNLGPSQLSEHRWTSTWDPPSSVGAAGRMPEDMPDKVPECLPDRMPEGMPDGMSDRMPEGMPDKVPERLPEHMPEDFPDRMPEDMPVDMPDRVPEDMPEHMPEDMPGRMPEDISDRMPEDMPDRMPGRYAR